MTLDTVEPARDRVLVRVDKAQEETTSGIVLAPTTASSNLPSEGQVIATFLSS